MGSTFPSDDAWKQVKIGAGGFITGIDVAPDGTIVARTDTYGAYIWNGTGWDQLVTRDSMPSNVLYTDGVYEIRVAASNSNIFYMTLHDGIYRSVDRGQSWTKTSFPVDGFNANSSFRTDGQKMAIDPSNPNVVFAGTQGNGLWVTRDGGTSWSKIAAVPQGTNTTDPTLAGIVIKGSTVYVGTAGSGVWASSDGGYTWKGIGGPADVRYGVISPDGSYYATGQTDTSLWKYSNGVWTKLISGEAHAVAIDPFDSNHLVATRASGHVQVSYDAGKTWTGWEWNNNLESSSDVPWLETSGAYMSTGGVVFDPLVKGKVWQSTGTGVWTTSIEGFKGWAPITWTSHSQGIEQLVPNDIIAPAGGDPIFGSWDRAFFTMADVDQYASSYGGGGFSMGWSLDYASSNPSFVVGISDWWGSEDSGFSSDGGKTWQKFAGLPSWAKDTVGGSIAASTPTNFIWVGAGNQPAAYTLDGGKTWTNVSIPGLTDWSAVHHSYYLYRTAVTADRVQPNTFYLQDPNTGVYRTTDGGVTWSKVFSGQPSAWSMWSSKIEAVPGSAGELYFTSGPQGTDNPYGPESLLPFMHSKDGGASWQEVAGVQVSNFGYGAPATAGGPATVYIIGYVNGDYGIWYSADASKSWTKIGEKPMGTLDGLRNISGDMDKFGLVYVGTHGSGYTYLDFSGSASTPTPAQPTPLAPTPPSQTATILTATDDVDGQAVIASGASTNDKTPTLSGDLSATLASGQKLVVYRDGQQIGNVTPSGTSWTFTDPGATDGKHDYVVKVVDAAGQAGAASGTFTLTVDTLAPNQAVNVTGAALATVSSMQSLRTTSNASSDGGTLVSGTLAGSLGTDETVAVFRDGQKVGTATVSNGSWSFTDAVTFGTFKYTAQVQDAAGNFGQMSSALAVTLGVNTIEGTSRNDVLVGTSGIDVISGVGNGKSLGKGTIDTLIGGLGGDTFVLGDTRGRFYDDGSARSSGADDFARITDFGTGDKLQVKGSAAEYLQGWINNLQGFTGTGIYHDSNGNGILDNRDELIALVQNHGPIDAGSFIYV